MCLVTERINCVYFIFDSPFVPLLMFKKSFSRGRLRFFNNNVSLILSFLRKDRVRIYIFSIHFVSPPFDNLGIRIFKW